jgi:hypothetical protein
MFFASQRWQKPELVDSKSVLFDGVNSGLIEVKSSMQENLSVVPWQVVHEMLTQVLEKECTVFQDPSENKFRL